MLLEHHKSHRLAPVDIQPSEAGNILVTGDLYEIVPAEERAKVLLRGYVLRKSHFATCTEKKPAAKTNLGPPGKVLSIESWKDSQRSS
jgi:hypothetical protein